MLHDDGVVLPVVGVVGQHLQLAIGDVPVLVRGCLVQNRLELGCLKDASALSFPATDKHESEGCAQAGRVHDGAAATGGSTYMLEAAL